MWGYIKTTRISQESKESSKYMNTNGHLVNSDFNLLSPWPDKFQLQYSPIFIPWVSRHPNT